MKNMLTLFAFITQISFAQSVFPADGGNVGIGTINPLSKLDVIGSTRFRETNSSYYSELSSDVNNAYLRSSGVSNSFLIYDTSGKPIVMQPYLGNVGIGTSNPLSKLDVIGSAKFRETNSFYYSELSSDVNNAYLRSSGVANSFLIYDISGKPIVMQPYLGNVGIGTANPDAKLVVNGDAKVKENLFISGSSGGYTIGDNPTLYFGVNNNFAKINIPFGDKMILSSYHGYTFNTSYNGATALPALTIGITGNVGIGKVDPTNKLEVNGTIHSKEVKVDMDNWSDFVFKKEYNLPTLEEVEKHIAEKGYLENIPSEKEVLQNGINLGEMNAKLLQKIEEMTLYMIEQNKQIIDLKTRLEKVETASVK